MDRPLSAARKASVDEQDPVDTACRVQQAIQRENDPVQSPDLISRNMVSLRLPHAALPPLKLHLIHSKQQFNLLYTVMT